MTDVDRTSDDTQSLLECQASLRDGECTHRLCPNGGMRDIPYSCPLPWLRMDRALEDEA